MKTISKWATALVLLSGAAYAQDPSTNDTSDAYQNTGMGAGALIRVTPSPLLGIDNTAAGYQALYYNTTGNYNAAFGNSALYSNETGIWNTAAGTSALASNTTGSYNTASGSQALQVNSTGSYNTATGSLALFASSGNDNTATGFEALEENLSGSFNTASGYRALYRNSTGNNNTATGIAALKSNTTGSYNIAVGNDAGLNVTTGSHNIEIGNEGTTSDNNMIKIGTEGTQAETFIAGIYSNTAVSGLAVVVGSNGELGAVSSSERFKTAIAPMGSNTSKLLQLRPVTFRYKADAQGTPRYGLIAEEVAKVYPELVVRDRNGRIDGVRYDELSPMLLNEVQKQAAEIRDLKQQVAALNNLKQEMRAALLKLQIKDQVVAQR